MTNQALEDKLRYLRLSAMQQTVQQRNQYALDNKLSYMEFFEMLIEEKLVANESFRIYMELSKETINELRGKMRSIRAKNERATS